jgi:uncharacterized protein (DUF427 family)
MKLTIKEKNSDLVIASGDDKTAQVFEGNWYFKPEAVDMTHLRVTDRTYTCPYKGVCYWVDLEAPGMTAQNIGWTYFDTKTGYDFIKGKIAFYARDTQGTYAVKE